MKNSNTMTAPRLHGVSGTSFNSIFDAVRGRILRIVENSDRPSPEVLGYWNAFLTCDTRKELIERPSRRIVTLETRDFFIPNYVANSLGITYGRAQHPSTTSVFASMGKLIQLVPSNVDFQQALWTKHVEEVAAFLNHVNGGVNQRPGLRTLAFWGILEGMLGDLIEDMMPRMTRVYLPAWAEGFYSGVKSSFADGFSLRVEREMQQPQYDTAPESTVNETCRMVVRHFEFVYGLRAGDTPIIM